MTRVHGYTIQCIDINIEFKIGKYWKYPKVDIENNGIMLNAEMCTIM